MGKKKTPEVQNDLVLTPDQRAQVLNGLPDMARDVLDRMVQNGLGAACGYSGGNFGANPLGWQSQNPFAPEISQANSLFLNLRWYLISNMRQLLCQAYVEMGLIRKLCQMPVDDALRGGITLKSKQLDEDQIQELQISLDREDDINTVGQAMVWNRLFGGAGVLVMTDQDPEVPLDLKLIGPDSPLEFRAVDMWELFWDQQNTEGYDPELQTQDFEWYNYYALKLHKSRVMRLKGLVAPSFLRPRLRGWGFSVVESVMRALNQYLKNTDVTFEVMDEFKVDIFKIKNLVNTLLSPNGEQKMRQRIQFAAWQKNYQNALIMDSEDDWDHKQLSFTGLAETMKEIRAQICSEMSFPPVKLWGSQGGGLGKDDESELEVYNAMVESEIRSKIKYDLLRICEIKSQKLFGFIPDDFELEFKPLRILSSVDEETVKTSKFTRAITAKTAGELTTEEFRDICNRDNLFPIKLDTNVASLNPDDPDTAETTEGEPLDPKKVADPNDPGADKIDTRRPHAVETETDNKPRKEKEE